MKTNITVSVDVEAVTKARAMNINISEACEIGLLSAVRMKPLAGEDAVRELEASMGENAVKTLRNYNGPFPEKFVRAYCKHHNIKKPKDNTISALIQRLGL